jgi:hypothetical protein
MGKGMCSALLQPLHGWAEVPIYRGQGTELVAL